MPNSQHTGHLTDGDLVRLLDGEITGIEQVEATAHLAGCESCQSRFRRIERRSARLGSLLDSLTTPAPPVTAESPATTRIWIRRAAVITLLIGAGVFATPAGATLARWISSQLTALAGAQKADPAPEDTMPPGDPAVTRVRFAATPEFVVEFDSHQDAGTISVELGSGDEAVFEVLHGDVVTRNGGRERETARTQGAVPVELVVLPTGLRVRNLAHTAANYRILVPPSSQLVRIRIGDSPPSELSAAALGRPATSRTRHGSPESAQFDMRRSP